MKRKILVVDDDADVLDLIQFTLQKAGFAIGTAHDGVEALKKICSLAPDLIILDLMMPELDGFAVCEILRRDPGTQNIPVIILTAASSRLTRLAGLEAGATELLSKPFSPKELTIRIKALLQTGYSGMALKTKV